MAKHVFLSFVQEDLDSVNLFRGQAKNEKSDLAFSDYSVTVPYNSTDAAYIRGRITERIRACSVAICLIGEKTAESPWVDWELRKSVELGKKLVGVRLHGSPTRDKTPTALAREQILNWDIDAVVRAIG